MANKLIKHLSPQPKLAKHYKAHFLSEALLSRVPAALAFGECDTLIFSCRAMCARLTQHLSPAQNCHFLLSARRNLHGRPAGRAVSSRGITQVLVFLGRRNPSNPPWSSSRSRRAAPRPEHQPAMPQKPPSQCPSSSWCFRVRPTAPQRTEDDGRDLTGESKANEGPQH